jgi:phosphate transport system protein
MSRPTFERNLRELQDEVLVMGSMVNKALNQAMDSLKRRDHHLAKYVIDNDKEINRLRFAIEEQALTMIATQQPVVAHDLRIVAAVINIVGELERMGDHAKGIARITQLMEDQPLVKPLIDLPKMAEKCSLMLDGALEAFLRQDAEAARRVANCDDEIDVLYDQIYQELLQIMLSDSQTVNRATYLLWAAHNLERFGDRITNICERIIFVVTGEMVEIVGQPHNDYNPPSLIPASARQELEG